MSDVVNTAPEDASQPGARLAAALQATSTALWDWDCSTRNLIVSDGLRQLFGAEPGETFDLRTFLDAIHPEDRMIWRRLFEDARTAALPDTLEFRGRRLHTGEPRWFRSDVRPSRHDGRVTGLAGFVADLSAERRAALALIESEERLRIAIEAGRMAVWEVDLATGSLAQSPELNLLLGLPSEARPTLADVRALYAPGELERIASAGMNYESIKEAVLDGNIAKRRDWLENPGADRTQIQAEFTILTPAGAAKELMLRAQYAAPAIDGGGHRVTGLLIDITDRKQAERQHLIVAREMRHRIRNTLTVVSALAARTFRADGAVEAMISAFRGRLGALSAATDAILDDGGTSVALREVVERIFMPYRTPEHDPFSVEGPDLELDAQRGTALGMALHELCTNAVKYGALTVSTGHVSIAWRLDSGGLVLEWRESGGPVVTEPEHRGFGTRLLGSVLGADAVALSFEPAGVVCRIELPVKPGTDS
jgi:PAS domain S-box-containing protein